MFSRRVPLKLAAAALAGTLTYKNFTENNPTLKPLYALSPNYSRKFYPASAEYPDVTKNRNIMSRSLSHQLYARLRDLRTPNGFTVDDAIQTGVDNSGQFSTTGCIAGDEETYQLFRELFDKVILAKHGFKHEDRHVNDTDAGKLKNAQLDPEYVLSLRARTIRNISGYCFPSFCTRGERRDVESLVARALYDIDRAYKGVYYSLKELSSEEEQFLVQNNLAMERPYLPDEMSANLSRDWPDARGLWVNQDGTLAAFVNKRDHISIASCDKTSNFHEVFEKLYTLTDQLTKRLKAKKWRVMYDSRLGYLTTDPKDLGTGLKFSARMKLPALSQDHRISALLKMLNLNQKYKRIESEENVLEVSSSRTMGKSEVQIAQDFIDSINQLIVAEKRVQSGEPLAEILYKE